MKLPTIVGMLLILVLALLACGGLTVRIGQASEAEQHYQAGNKLRDQRQFEKAIAEYDEALRLDPKLAIAYNNRGGAYDNLGQHQRAIQDLDEALRLDPKLAEAYATRAAAYAVLRKYEEAERDVARAVELGLDAARLKAAIEEIKRRR
jgi:tetratricopeptide (TPR) repeat protein